MNTVNLIGRLTDEPELRYTQGNDPIPVARYRLAVDRGDKEKTADFIPVTVWRAGADFASKYFHKGLRVGVTGTLRTGSYTGNDGKKVYTWEVVASRQFFADGKAGEPEEAKPDENGFMTIPEGAVDELPFN